MASKPGVTLPLPTEQKLTDRSPKPPTRAEAEHAIDTLLRWVGEDPKRDGLRLTPSRVVDAYGEWFAGYAQDPEAILKTTFEEIEGYQAMVVLREIRFESHCEHHMAPIIGKAWVAYIPRGSSAEDIVDQVRLLIS